MFACPVLLFVHAHHSTAVLEVQANQLEGEIPIELYNLSNLRIFRVADNANIVGTLSPLVGQLSKLYELGLNATQIGGQLPDSLFTLTDMRLMYLDNAQFSGTLSQNFSSFKELERLSLQNNRFSGPVPAAAFATLPVLSEFCCY